MSSTTVDPFASSSVTPIEKSEHVTTSSSNASLLATNSHLSTNTFKDSTTAPTRPRLIKRVSSGTMIIPRDAPVHAPPREFGPDDARSMSPRRSSEETDEMFDRLDQAHRASLEALALQYQDNLASIAAKINEMAQNCESLAAHNQALQDVIGDMTRSISSEPLSKGKSKK